MHETGGSSMSEKMTDETQKNKEKLDKKCLKL